MTLVEHLKGQLAALSSQEKAELAHFLIHSLDETEEGVEAAWELEVSRRVQEIKEGKVVGTPAPRLFSELREKYS